MTTNQKEFIDCQLPDQCPITFDKRTAKKYKILESTLANSDMQSFGSDIGYITNCSTALYSMLENFEEDSEEYKEIKKRLLICRKLQGESIDHAKGIQTDPFPQYWVDEKKSRNDLDKKLVIKRKPYFQRYVYSSLNRTYMKYAKDLNDYSLTHYGIPAEENQDPEFLEFKEKDCPVLDNDSPMNRVCHYLESQVQEIKRDCKKQDQFILDSILIDNDYDLLLEYEDFVKDVLREYKLIRAKEKESGINRVTSGENEFDDNFYSICNSFRNKLLEVFPDNHTMANMLVYVGYQSRVQENKDFVWNVAGEDVLENVLENKQEHIIVPCEDESGDIKYLGKKYSRKEIVVKDYDYF